MRISKFLSFLMVLFLPMTASAKFPINSSWNSIGDGWSCINQRTTAFPGDHYEIDCSTSTPDLSCSLKITYPANWYAGGEPAHCWNQFGAAKSEIYGQFYFKFSSGYTWNNVVNKLVYITPGPDVFAAGDVIGVVGQKIQVRNQYAETANYTSNTGYNPTINTNQWYKITWYSKVNTPGSKNGLVKLWINDTLAINYSNVMWLRSTDDGKGFYELTITPVYGGGRDTGVDKPKDEYLWYDRTIVQSTPINSVEPPASDKTPEPPKYLSIQ